MAKKYLSEPNFMCLNCEMSLNILCGKCNTRLVYETAIKAGGIDVVGAKCPKHGDWIKLPVCDRCDKAMSPLY